jgi:hypothetical protein
MKKTNKHKLSLSPETLRRLDGSHLDEVAGGWTTVLDCPSNTCRTIVVNKDTKGTFSGQTLDKGWKCYSGDCGLIG